VHGLDLAFEAASGNRPDLVIPHMGLLSYGPVAGLDNALGSLTFGSVLGLRLLCNGLISTTTPSPVGSVDCLSRPAAWAKQPHQTVAP
jgi:hypothetical protein